MKRYWVVFKYSKNGRTWTTTSLTVMAESDMSAIAQVSSKYPYVQIVSVR